MDSYVYSSYIVIRVNSRKVVAIEMSTIITLTGNASELRSDFDPPILLGEEEQYVMGLLSFETYNSIPNVTAPNNTFKLESDEIILPQGAYELSDLNEVINNLCGIGSVEIKGNNSTMKTLIKSTKLIDFTPSTSIGRLLGFNAQTYPANVWHESEQLTNIMKINSLLIHCNITLGSFKNGIQSHVIHQFFPTVPPGYKIVVAPNPIIYLPVSAKTITNITVKVTDQDDNPVSFSSETVTVGLHLRKV